MIMEKCSIEGVPAVYGAERWRYRGEVASESSIKMRIWLYWLASAAPIKIGTDYEM